MLYNREAGDTSQEALGKDMGVCPIVCYNFISEGSQHLSSELFVYMLAHMMAVLPCHKPALLTMHCEGLQNTCQGLCCKVSALCVACKANVATKATGRPAGHSSLPPASNYQEANFARS
jgi:hypothetical protein